MNQQSQRSGHPFIALKKPDFYLLATLLMSLGIATFVQWPAITDPLAINDDVRNQVYWLARLVDPSLYPQDYIAGYFTQSSLISPLLWVIYRISSLFMDPLRASQLLPLLLAPMASWFAYRYGENFAGKRYGFLVALCFNLMVWTSRNLAGGLARAFAYPLLFAFLHFLSRKNRVGLVLTTWTASLIYPPVLFLSAGIWLLELELFTRTQRKPQASSLVTSIENAPEPSLYAQEVANDKLTALLGLSGSLGILLYRFVVHHINPMFGALTNAAQAAATPEFYAGGRVPIFHYFKAPIVYNGLSSLLMEFWARTPGLNRLLPLLGILLIYWGYQKWLAPRLVACKLPHLAWQTLIAAVGLYILSWPALFYLYVPERYLQLSLTVLYTLMLAGFLDIAVSLILKHGKGPQIKMAKIALCAGPLALCAMFSPAWDKNLAVPVPSMRPILGILKQTPKDSMVASTPGLASDVPYYAKRSVILSEEGYIPFHQTYFREMRTRLREFLSAYYATDPKAVASFIQKYKINYIIVNLADYNTEHTQKLWRKYYRAFPKSYFNELVQRRSPEDFILSHANPQCQVVHSGQLELLRAKDILAGWCLDHSQPIPP